MGHPEIDWGNIRRTKRIDEKITAEQTASDLWWEFNDREVVLAQCFMLGMNQRQAFEHIEVSKPEGEKLVRKMRKKVILYEAGQRGVLIK